jgi:hypothetical protein
MIVTVVRGIALLCGLSLRAACGALIGIEDTHDEALGIDGAPNPSGDGGDVDGAEEEFDAGPTQEAEDDATIVDLDGGAPGSEAAADAIAPPTCDLTKPFGAPQPLNVNSAAYETGARFSADELTLWFQRRSSKNALDGDIYVTTRPDKSTAFGTPKKVTELNSATAEGSPSVTGDGLLAYLASFRTGSNGDLYRASRAATANAWGAPVRLASISTTYSDDDPFLLQDGRAVYWDSLRGGNGNIYRASVDTAGNPGTAVTVTGINTTAKESEPAVTLDELTIYFARVDSTTKQIYVAKRATSTASWGAATAVTELNSTADDHPDWVSADGCHIAFTSLRSGGAGLADVYFATKP